MDDKTQREADLLIEVQELRRRLHEAGQALNAMNPCGKSASGRPGGGCEGNHPLKGADRACRTLVETMNEGALILSRDGTIHYCNNRFADMLGTVPQKLIGSSIFHRVSPDEYDRFKGFVQDAERKGFETESLLAATGGTLTPVRFSASPLREEDFQGYCVIATNLAFQKRAEEELKHARKALQLEHSKFTDILEAMNDQVFIITAQYEVVYLNSAAKREFGSAEGRKCYEYFRNRTDSCPWCRNEDVFEGRTVQWILTSVNTGKIYDVFDAPLRNADGTVSKLEIMHDITELKNVEASLRESKDQLRTLSLKLLKAQEEERRRIAAEIHDSIASSLSAVKFGIENTLCRAGGGLIDTEASRTLISTIDTSIEESRRIINDLRPSLLDDLGIVVTIGWLCRRFRNLHPDMDVIERIELTEGDVPEPLKIVMYRIIQEAFTNIAKYSGAKRAAVSLCKTENAIELIVEDDGAGFDMNGVLSGKNYESGIGLTSMRERTEYSGGSFSIASSLGNGTAIRTSWPL